MHGAPLGRLGADGVEEDQEHKDLPTQPQLLQNYPNPFNPNTLSVACGAEVQLTIYNLAGQIVRRLVKEVQAGTYRVVWNGRDARDKHLGSGGVPYRLQVGTFEKTRHMVVVK